MNSTQDNKNNSSKFIFISVILVAILVILVLCLSFTAFKKAISAVGDDRNNQNSGANDGINSRISMTYTEDMNGISIQDALPITDEVGKRLSSNGEYFDFTIRSNILNNSITYEIAAIKDNDSTISDDDIKLYLEKQNSGTYESVMEPTVFTPITKKTKIGSPTGSMVLYKVTKTKSGTDNYRLRMWIREDASVELDKVYTVKINVYGKAS